MITKTLAGISLFNHFSLMLLGFCRLGRESLLCSCKALETLTLSEKKNNSDRTTLFIVLVLPLPGKVTTVTTC